MSNCPSSLDTLLMQHMYLSIVSLSKAAQCCNTITNNEHTLQEMILLNCWPAVYLPVSARELVCPLNEPENTEVCVFTSEQRNYELSQSRLPFSHRDAAILPQSRPIIMLVFPFLHWGISSGTMQSHCMVLENTLWFQKWNWLDV